MDNVPRGRTGLTGTWYGPFTKKNIAAAARSFFYFAQDYSVIQKD